MEDVIPPPELARPLQRQDVQRLLDHAQPRLFAIRITADRAARAASLKLKQTSQKTTCSRTATSAAASVRASAVGGTQQVVRQPLGSLGSAAREPR